MCILTKCLGFLALRTPEAKDFKEQCLQFWSFIFLSMQLYSPGLHTREVVGTVYTSM